jgi:hypothetical protein
MFQTFYGGYLLYLGREERAALGRRLNEPYPQFVSVLLRIPPAFKPSRLSFLLGLWAQYPPSLQRVEWNTDNNNRQNLPPPTPNRTPYAITTSCLPAPNRHHIIWSSLNAHGPLSPVIHPDLPSPLRSVQSQAKETKEERARHYRVCLDEKQCSTPRTPRISKFAAPCYVLYSKYHQWGREGEVKKRCYHGRLVFGLLAGATLNATFPPRPGCRY